MEVHAANRNVCVSTGIQKWKNAVVKQIRESNHRKLGADQEERLD